MPALIILLIASCYILLASMAWGVVMYLEINSCDECNTLAEALKHITGYGKHATVAAFIAAFWPIASVCWVLSMLGHGPIWLVKKTAIASCNLLLNRNINN